MILFNRYLIKDQRKFKRFIFVLVLIISVVTFTSITTISAYSKDIAKFDYITVQKGDTFWSIATDYARNKDVREVIYIISEINNINNKPIIPGDKIKIPLN